MYDIAVMLIKKGKAYVCDLSADEVREYRGTLKEIGKNSPFRDRTIEENLTLFEAMRNGEFETGSFVFELEMSNVLKEVDLYQS
jgi:glutaminyl-tRNA synthetase